MSLPLRCSARPPSLFLFTTSPVSLLSKTKSPRLHLALRQRSFQTYSFSYTRPHLQRLKTSPLRYYSTVHLHSKPRTRFRRTISFLLIASTTFTLSAYLALTYAPPILHPAIFQAKNTGKLTMGSHVLTDEETLTLFEPVDDFTREVNEHIITHPLAVELRGDPTWLESRPHLRIPDAIKHHNLTAGTLSGPGMITVPPLYFNKHDGSEMVQFFYVGDSVSGHPGIVHGGFLATMLDEGLARCAFQAMPNKVGVTANLKINYRRPVMAGQFLVLRARTIKVEGRKAWSEGWIESLEEGEKEVNGEEPPLATGERKEEKVKLVEAEALFVEPKHAKVRTTGPLCNEVLGMLGLAKVETPTPLPLPNPKSKPATTSKSKAEA